MGPGRLAVLGARWWRAALLGAIVAVAGGLAPACGRVRAFEEYLGLEILFRLRGARRPPPEVVVVAIDDDSARALGLPAEPQRWSRTLHARLLDGLVRAGARVVVFDLFFEQSRPGEDAVLAAALRRTGRVLLASYLERVVAPGGAAVVAGPRIERVVPPAAALYRAALGAAPFPLPKIPARVSRFWTFKPGSGDLPSLPMLTLQAMATDALDALADRFDPRSDVADSPTAGDDRRAPRRELERAVQRLRALAMRPVGTGAGEAAPASDRVFAALLAAYTGPADRYLDFYGPPGSLPRIPYHRLLAGEGQASPFHDLHGRVAFVGLVDAYGARQKDHFPTVFTDAEGVRLSGVEIAATAFANLLEGRTVEPLPAVGQTALLVCFGLVFGTIAQLLPPAGAVAALSLLAAAYLGLAVWRFSAVAAWYPLTVPLLLQVPAALGVATVWRLAAARRDRARVRAALGFYVPQDLVDDVVRRIGDPGSAMRLVRGTCLATDVASYTALSESLSAPMLHELMNRYFATVLAPVRCRGGVVSDVVGDAMLAVWPSDEQDREARRQACLAALEIVEETERMRDDAGTTRLRTRVGLQAGELVLGQVGAAGRLQYQAIGDVVNTATRLQSLNRHLGTRILAGGAVLAGVDGLLTREVGTFLLAGKSQPVVVHEVVGRAEEATEPQRILCARFAAALRDLRAGLVREAHAAFRALANDRADGPSAFYAAWCATRDRRAAGEPWDMVVRMEDK